MIKEMTLVNKAQSWVQGHKLVLMALLGVLILVFPFFGTSSLIRLMTTVFIYSLTALGLMMIFGFTGMMCTGFAAFYGTGAYVTAIFATRFESPFVFTLILSGIITGILGFITCVP